MIDVSTIPVICDVAETARLLGVSNRAIRRILAEGRMPMTPIRLGARRVQYRGIEIAALLEGRAAVSLDDFRRLATSRSSKGLHSASERRDHPVAATLPPERTRTEPFSMSKSDLPRGIQRIDPRTDRALGAGEERAVRDWKYRASVRVQGRLWQKVYPQDVKPTPSAAIKFIMEERGVHRRRLEAGHREAEAFGPREGTIAKDIEAYLEFKREMPSYEDRKREIGMWIPRFGHRVKNDVKPQEIAKQIADWHSEKRDKGSARYATTTINHWRTALGDFYTRLNGRSGYNPLRDVPKLPEPDAIDRAQPMPIIERVLAAMEENGKAFAEKIAGATGQKLAADFGLHSAIRSKILAHTGMRSGELKKLKPTDIRFDEQVVLIRTGKGGINRRVPLNSKAIGAFREFRKADLFGGFSSSSLGKTVEAACKNVKTADGESIAAIRPHDFRHSFATWLVNEGGVSIKTAKNMLGHRNIQTTERYVRASEDDARRAMKRLESIA